MSHESNRAVSSVISRADAGGKEGDDSKLDAVMAKLDAVLKRQDEAAEERKADRARVDAACARMDAYDAADKARKDAEEKERADKARADAEEKERCDAKARKDAEEKEAKEKEEKERADKARADAEEKARADAVAAAGKNQPGNDDIRARIEALEKGMSTEDVARFSQVQVRAEPVYQAFGDSQGAPRWMHGESLSEYRRRLLTKLKQHSADWKDVDLTKIHDEQAFGVAETRIYADAMDAALHPTDLPPNVLRTITKRDHSGRTMYSFVGADDAAWSQFTFFPTQIRAGRIRTQAQRD